MTTSLAHAPRRLALSDGPLEAPVAASWIGPLVALGARISRYKAKLASDRQLVVVLSVPRRDFAAALIGCGWVMNSAAPELAEPIELFRGLHPGDRVRLVTHSEVIVDSFQGLDEKNRHPRVRLSRSQWLVSAVHAAAALPDDCEDRHVRMPRPRPGSLARMSRLDVGWDARLAEPSADLAVIGTLKWLTEDLAACLTCEGEQVASDLGPETGVAGPHGAQPETSGTVADLLLPDGKKCATWFTTLYPSARLSDQLPLSDNLKAAILDGAGAVRYLAEVETPLVICILDRSVADETSAELVVQLRNSRGEPLSLRDDLGWRPPAGIEALAFTVAL